MTSSWEFEHGLSRFSAEVVQDHLIVSKQESTGGWLKFHEQPMADFVRFGFGPPYVETFLPIKVLRPLLASYGQSSVPDWPTYSPKDRSLFSAVFDPENPLDDLRKLVRRSTPNLHDRAGLSPLWYAVLNQNISAIRVLLRKGSELNKTYINAPHENAETVAHLALSMGSLRILRVLLKSGLNIQLQNSRGQNSLFALNSLRLHSPHLVMPACHLLTRSGIELNLVDRNGESPLAFFIRQGMDRVAAQLLHLGATPNTLDHLGYSPLLRATERLCSATADQSKTLLPLIWLLLRRQADTQVTLKNGDTAATFVEQCGNLEAESKSRLLSRLSKRRPVR